MCSFVVWDQGAKISGSQYGEKYLNDLYLKSIRYFYEKEIRVVAEKNPGVDKEEMVLRFESVYLPRGTV